MQETSSCDGLGTRSSAEVTPLAQEDRRRHPRFLLTLAITMEGDNNFYSGLSENLSEAGVFIATHTMLPIGTPVALSFTLPCSDKAISAVGIIRWMRGPEATASSEANFGQSREAASVRAGIGVQFTEVAKESLDEIRAFMLRRDPEFYD